VKKESFLKLLDVFSLCSGYHQNLYIEKDLFKSKEKCLKKEFWRAKMVGIFSKIKEKFSSPKYEELEEEQPEYVELDTDLEHTRHKVIVRPFILESFDDLKPVLDALREGYTIALVNIKPIKDKDLVELKRAINKLKKTTEAIEGEIAGFGDDYLVVTPSFATIFRNKQMRKVEEE